MLSYQKGKNDKDSRGRSGSDSSGGGKRARRQHDWSKRHLGNERKRGFIWERTFIWERAFIWERCCAAGCGSACAFKWERRCAIGCGSAFEPERECPGSSPISD